MKPSTISVIIPTVNASSELDLAVASLKKNSDQAVELCVIVDPDMVTGQVNQAILKVCQKHGVKPHINQTNLGPYGSWNRGAVVATGQYLVFATDDQYFAPHWDSNLKKYHRRRRLVAGRLVEPGIIPVFKGNIQADFGTTAKTFREQEFTKWCANRRELGFVKDGFFIPLLVHRQDFVELGGYPVQGKFGTSSAVSNDVLFIKRAVKKGFQFGTAADSYSYHFQASSWKKKTLKPKIAAVVLTQNEEQDLPQCLKSLSWTTDIFVIDSGSTDQTLDIAKKFQAHIIKHQFKDFASQRNFAISKVRSYDWVLMVDADEVVTAELAQELRSFAKDIYLDGVDVPRHNFIFGKQIDHADWYPDYRLVFFRPKLVTFIGAVHERIKYVLGNGTSAKASGHLLHQNYASVTEFMHKNLIIYPQQYAKMMQEKGVQFSPVEMLRSSTGEFYRRFFLTHGWQDGMHGLILSLLMGAQTLLTYVYLWELQGKKPDLTATEIHRLFQSLRTKGSELRYWLYSLSVENAHGVGKLVHRVRRKALKLVKGI